MHYRENAKPPEKAKELLYKKPWWQIWDNRASWEHSETKYRYVWYYTKKWSTTSSANRLNVLYYTTKGNWVLIIHGSKTQVLGVIYNWCLHGETFDELTQKVEEIESCPDLPADWQILLRTKEAGDEHSKLVPTIIHL